MYQVLVYDEPWTTVEMLESAQEAINGIIHLNRWWKVDHNHKRVRIETAPSHYIPSNPLLREWRCTWIPGHQGWDCRPLPPGSFGRELVVCNTNQAQETFVRAPSAILAIERSKFLLMERGGKEKVHDEPIDGDTQDDDADWDTDLQ